MRTYTVQKRRLMAALLTLVVAGFGYLFREPLGRASSNISTAQLSADYTVSQVVDGDTIKVRLGDKTETVRLIGVDTPETHDPRKSVQCFGEQAATNSRHLMQGKRVRLEADPNDSDRDKYGRLLRYVYVDSTLINTEIIRGGYGFAYTVFPFARLNEFRALEQEARTTGRGLWAGCQIDESNKIKQTNNVE